MATAVATAEDQDVSDAPNLDDTSSALVILVTSGDVGHLAQQFNSAVAFFRLRWNRFVAARRRLNESLSDTQRIKEAKGAF